MFIMSVCPSVRMYQHGSYWTDFHDIWYAKLVWRSVESLQIWLKSGRRVGHFTWRPQYVLLLPARYTRHKSISVRHSVLLNCWQWHEAQRCSLPLQQWLRERATVLRNAYIACLVIFTDMSRSAAWCVSVVVLISFRILSYLRLVFRKQTLPSRGLLETLRVPNQTSASLSH
jgi:hypothetical protein